MKFRFILIIVTGILLSAELTPAAELLNVRYWSAPDHTRVVIDMGSASSFDFQENEKVLTISFRDSFTLLSLPAVIEINKPGIKKIILNQVADGLIKADFYLDKYLQTQVFQLKKFQDKPDRIVVDIFIQDASTAEIAREPVSKKKLKKIIVIDPGHGGDDPGAIGKKGTYEKHIVLSLGREIKKTINRIPGYKAFLTRDGDYYVSFNKRLQTAKELNANLFISVHADAARNRKARGSSVYCLSTGAASNEAARILANNENLSDIIGGVSNGDGKTDSDQIILNMFQTNTINLSKTYAVNLMQQLNKVNSLKYKSVQEAPFRVLKLPDIPAVLIETAYISNTTEERLLKNNKFRKKMASAIASSVSEYLAGQASLDQVSDTGSGLSKDIESTEKKSQEKAAGLNEAITGQQKKKGALRTYIVKKGDTLFSLAKNNSITVDELCELNHMKSSDPLLSGHKIKLP